VAPFADSRSDPNVQPDLEATGPNAVLADGRGAIVITQSIAPKLRERWLEIFFWDREEVF
jgi:hypothetical protein